MTSRAIQPGVREHDGRQPLASRHQPRGTALAKKKRFNRPSESVWWPALLFRIRFFPARTKNNTRHKVERAKLVMWRRKNIDMPYKRRLKAERKAARR